MKSNEFIGYHSEWNLGSPGGWDYQRITQEIGKEVFTFLSRHVNFGLELDFEDEVIAGCVLTHGGEIKAEQYK